MNASRSASPLVAKALSAKSPVLQLLLETCNGLPQLKVVHAHMLRSQLIADVFCASRLLAFCVDPPTGADRPSLLYYAEKVFSLVDQPNLFMYNAMIRGWSGHGGDPSRSLDLLRQMLRMGLRPDNLTFPFVFKACAALGYGGMGRQVHGQVVLVGLWGDPYVQSSLLHMYARCGNGGAASRLFREIERPDAVIWTTMVLVYSQCGELLSARKMFDEMPERNTATWSCMISGYAKNGHFEEALDLFRSMQLEKVRANEAAMVGVLTSCANLGTLEGGKMAHEYMVRHNIVLNLILGTALVEMYAKCGDIQRAIAIFEQLPERDWLSWTTMITGLAMHGCTLMALEYFSKMVGAGVAPRAITFTAVLSVCSHGGLVSRGFELFESMKKDHRIEPRMEHYGCMVDLLGRAGKLQEAERFVLEMPVEPDGSIWGALLGACRIHRNSAMGKRVGEILTQLQPEHGGYYVLASNICAKAGQWEGVSELRRAMKERGVKKELGHSLVELDGRAHLFITGDKSHPEIGKIEEMWEEILQRIRAAGYVGRTGEVLFDIEEEEKDSALAKHSEKLAIALGVMKTGPGATIRIVKNLRVCEDCHEVTKLVSEVFHREFIVRDRNRFHHFKGGKCSCLDYW
ncbi:unnamed protein product [Spirodela intermedia]|uniref:DYW domain-containing protein n=1 Tax=Spirodela intermedia TaxID=51605 RepID=A0A7I8KPJ4_SPIIN|nr:unnamed protein product [Spirodela intermedia]